MKCHYDNESFQTAQAIPHAWRPMGNKMTKEQMEQILLDNMQKIYLYCVRRLGNVAEAEDVASDIAVELIRSYDKVQNDDAVYGYVWAVAGNLCKNHWRRSKKHETTEIPENYAGMYELTPEETFIRQQDISMLRRELSLLSGKYREVMIAHCIRNESCEMIAKNMRMSVTNVKQYLFEGRKKVRKGMDMQREYGVYSYAPEKFRMDFWGASGEGYWELFERKLPGSIMLAVYDRPRTMEELSMEVGVSVPYLEEEVAKLEEYGLLIRKGQKYHSGIVIFDREFPDEVSKAAMAAILENIVGVKAAIEKGKALLKNTDYRCYPEDENAKGWFILLLIAWEAVWSSEEKMKTKLTFPLLENGSKGYVMGERGEIPLDLAGIYGMYALNCGFLRVINYKLLTEKVINPFEKGARDVLLACEERRGETTELEALSDMLEKKIVHIEDGRICPNYSEISEQDYLKLMDGLSEEIDTMAAVIAKLRDEAADSLAKRVPREIPGAREVGSIISMWSVLEHLVPPVLESGTLSRGTEDQNLTTLYVRKQ